MFIILEMICIQFTQTVVKITDSPKLKQTASRDLKKVGILFLIASILFLTWDILNQGIVNLRLDLIFIIVALIMTMIAIYCYYS